MAGGKETPRQKMIGMMYLVLTAMLALQVSSALLEKFQLLNNSMEMSSNAANKINQRTLDNIRDKVEKSGNRAFEVAIVKQAEEVRKLTSGMISEIDAIKTHITNEAGGGVDPETGKVKNPNEEDKVAIYMIGPTRNGKAYELKNKLNGFVDQMNKLAGTSFAPLALDGKDDPLAKRDKDQRNKDFAAVNFEQTPVPAALAVLSQRQSEIRRLEAEVLDALAAKVGAKDIKFDKILAMISAESNVVVAGTKFKGEMFIAASSTSLTPRMSLNGAPLRVQDGKGLIEFTAQGGAYDKEGLAAKSLSGTISFATPSGRDTTVTMRYEYKVAKPTYQIEAGTLPPLYLGCKNVLSVQSPALGALWNPVFTAEGASTMTGNKKGSVIIVPSSREVALNISNQGNLLGVEKFRVNRVPRPRLEYYINGALADDKRGVPANMARSVMVKAVADESLVNYSPEDANFRVGQVTVSLARGNRRVGNPVVISGPSGSIAALAQQATAGDRLVFEVSGVQRRNFKGDVVDAGVGTDTRNIPLN
ncbi:gliding motility protein GldM [Runella zeae]|uniref:type IX secretion system motor protein PorM/GldM n=1 Tax=Runella zeae TaxID=94255 RepID=UPI002354CEC0|nr:gliding motility protein GldM [Runella zeae]